MRKRLKQYIKSLRTFRVWHRLLGTTLAMLLVISAVTGILLALKKEVAVIQPPTQKGVSKTLDTWLPLDSLAQMATTAFHTAHPVEYDNYIDRMDVRPSKGIVKVLFERGYWEVQIDGTSGEIKSIAKRHSDWIEHLHDGSIVSNVFKLISMNVLGFGLLLLIATGLWLWYGPKRVRRLKSQK
ncbi:MAG: PepSY-associated TM helix domain-containing protein [Bacteroidota bacterium]